MPGFSASATRSASRWPRYRLLDFAASRLAVVKPTKARISIGATTNGTMIASILVWMPICRHDQPDVTAPAPPFQIAGAVLGASYCPRALWTS